jgi:PIN domain nuclease of toxin-antitoxin system
VIQKNDLSENLALLLDTHIIAWILAGDRRLKAHVRDIIFDGDTQLFVSAVIAWEYTDLALRGRLPSVELFENLQELLKIQLLDVPSSLWRLAETMPMLHKDPVDRMLIAHAIHADLTLVTSDKIMRDYPVKSLW